VLLFGAAALVVAAAAVGCHGGSQKPASASSDQVLRVDWSEDDGSLEPGQIGFATENVLMNIMDPLVKLTPDLRPVPNLAQSWDVSADGLTVTFHLRDDGRWTNGDPVTAHDFEWSWLRTISPVRAADWAYLFYGISGAEKYNTCDPAQRSCVPLRESVGVSAVDDHTLQVRLSSPQPWFPRLVAYQPFLAVHRPTVERYGDGWMDPEHIVTNGPFKLIRWVRDKQLDLARWDGWRNAEDVHLATVLGRFTPDGEARIKEFDRGEVDGFPGGYIPVIKGKPGYSFHPNMDTEFYAFNTKAVPDVNERRALALAIDRSSLRYEYAVPATGMTPLGTPGFDAINTGSPWLPEHGELAKAKQLMAAVNDPKRNLTLVVNETCDNCVQAAEAIRRMWKPLGIQVTIRRVEWAQYLSLTSRPLGPGVDVVRTGWYADYPDAYNFLQILGCAALANYTSFCDHGYDALLKQAVEIQDERERNGIYAQLEQRLFGPNGSVPVIPLWWTRVSSLVRENVKKFEVTGFGTETWTYLSDVSITKS
jgi:oligopeptide transport system substrate-binding protein